MSLRSRLANHFRAERLRREIDEELESHIAEAIAQGRDPAEARRALGGALQRREESRDIKLIPWLDSLRADAVFGWRQLQKRRLSSAAAILSLALAIGACTSAFRLIDALLLRPLPISGADRLYSMARRGLGPSGDFRVSESCEYPLLLRMREAAKDRAELIAVSYSDRVDLTYKSDEEMEKARRQFVSGSMFGAFGLRPAAGRLFNAADDQTPGAHAYAVLSYDYWTRRFARDPGVAGRSVRIGNDLYEITGVLGPGFTGTEPGAGIDIFVPATMNQYVTRSDASWFRPLALMKPGVPIEPLRLELHAIMRAFNEERAHGWKGESRLFIDRFLNQTLLLQPAPAGISGTQTDYRASLIALAVLVALVLLIACANVANLMTAQAAARASEMALRVSIGAGRRRLIQLVLVESAWLGVLAAITGGLFAWWVAPFVAGRINAPNNPAHLVLPLDWRVVGFGAVLTLAVTFLLGLPPALRAASVAPANALRGGGDPHSRRRMMRALVAVQVAFCFLVHLAAGLFVATFDRLAHQSIGFSPERVLTLSTVAKRPQPAVYWDQVASHLREVPGVESVALAGWPLLDGNGWNGFIWVDNKPTEVLAYFLGVSPGFANTMGITFVDGRDLRAGEAYPGATIVNEAFVKQCFGGGNAIGRWFEKESGDGVTRHRFQVVGVVRDARYRNLREPVTPTAYVPFPSLNSKGVEQLKASGAFIVRTVSANPLALASLLRLEVPRARSEFRVSNIRTQQELIDQNTIRERLLAMLGVFFAAVALLLAAVGLYGVLDYSVVARRRELGIRIAIGAPAGDTARQVTREIFVMVMVGGLAGLTLGIVSARYVEKLLFGVKATHPGMLIVPAGIVLSAALVAAVPAVIRALRIDPLAMLRPL